MPNISSRLCSRTQFPVKCSFKFNGHFSTAAEQFTSTGFAGALKHNTPFWIQGNVLHNVTAVLKTLSLHVLHKTYCPFNSAGHRQDPQSDFTKLGAGPANMWDGYTSHLHCEATNWLQGETSVHTINKACVKIKEDAWSVNINLVFQTIVIILNCFYVLLITNACCVACLFSQPYF